MDRPRKRQKVYAACQRCRSRKLGCDRVRPCQLCVRAGATCIPRGEPGPTEQEQEQEQEGEQAPRTDLQTQHAPPQTRPRYEEKAVLPEQSIVELSTQIVPRYSAYDTSALPGGKQIEEPVPRSSRPWQDTIGLSLPPKEVLDSLVDRFFTSVNWFMMVFHEEHFRRRYVNLVTSKQGVAPADNNFLWLALLAVGLGAHYSSSGESISQEKSPLQQLSETLLTQVENRFCRIIGSPNVEAVQICILLGSFHLFNGRPTAGLGILGSGVKIAQIIGLHRESMWRGLSDINRELRRWSWWALEIFDKYAAIAFGRPCTIDEIDCSVTPPVDVRLEGQLALPDNTLLEYHRRKFELYRMMGPFLGRRSQAHQLETVRNIHDQLLLWEKRLPHDLRLQTYKDDVPSGRPPLRQLQALALQLTYDNLRIILHRSVAFKDGEHSTNTDPIQDASFHREELLQSALRTSELGDYSRLLQACRRTHAVMHVGICLFTAGVVLCAVCLSMPLSVTSQRAKTGVMAILRLHRESFSSQHLLSVQSARILEDSVAAVMQSEQEHILGRPPHRPINIPPGIPREDDFVASSSRNTGQITGGSQPVENEAFLAPLQEVFAHHLQNGVFGIEPTSPMMPDEIAPSMPDSAEESPMLGPPNFSWNGDLYSMADPGFSDANQLWLWSDSTLPNFF